MFIQLFYRHKLPWSSTKLAFSFRQSQAFTFCFSFFWMFQAFTWINFYSDHATESFFSEVKFTEPNHWLRLGTSQYTVCSNLQLHTWQCGPHYWSHTNALHWLGDDPLRTQRQEEQNPPCFQQDIYSIGPHSIGLLRQWSTFQPQRLVVVSPSMIKATCDMTTCPLSQEENHQYAFKLQHMIKQDMQRGKDNLQTKHKCYIAV